MKVTKTIVALLMSFALLVPLSSVYASGASDSLVQRATKVYPATKTALVKVTPKATTEVNYNSNYIPITDIFSGRVDKVVWSGAEKTVRLMKDGQEAVFNFSGKSIKPAANQVILPTNWARLEKGKAVMNASVLSYIFEKNAELFDILGGNSNDKERLEWREKLAFLKIATTVTRSDKTLQIYISNIAFGQTKEKDLDNLGKRALEVYPGSKSILHVTKKGKETSTTYESSYLPVSDLFSGHVESIKWDNVAKTTTIVNDGKSVVLNFSGKAIEEKANQIVLPAEWARLENGKSLINANVLCYIFDPLAEELSDKERDDWAEKLSFLNISTEGIFSATDEYLQVFVTYNP